MKEKIFINTKLENYYSLFEFVGAYFLGLAIVGPIFAAEIGSWITAGVFLILMVLGFFAQSAVCAIMKTSRGESADGYEQDRKLYDFRYALPVYAICIAVLIAAAKVTDAYLRKISITGDYYYDSNSLLPFIIGLVAVISVIYGSFVWFFPYDRFLTGRANSVNLTLILVSFALYVFIMHTNAVAFLAICLAGYVLCMFIAMNQNSVNKTFRGTLVAFVNNDSRKFNFKYTLVVFGVGLFFTLLSYTVLSGLRTLGLIILVLILNHNRDGVEIGLDDPKAVTDNNNEMIFGDSNYAATADFWFFILFILLTVISIISVILLSRLAGNSLVEKIKNLIAKIIAFFKYKRLKSEKKAVKNDYSDNFTDVEERIVATKKPGYHRTFREFINDLNGCSDEERYRLAYAEFVRQNREKNPLMKVSMTPREMNESLRAGADSVDTKIETITDEYERIRFGNGKADKNTNDITNRICTFVRRNIS